MRLLRQAVRAGRRRALRFAATVALGAVLIGVAVAAWSVLRPVPDRTVFVPWSDVDAALARALADDPEVGFVPRVRFDVLTFDREDGLALRGTGRWYQAMVGSFTLPDVALVASVPEAGWALDGSALRIGAVAIRQADRLPFGETPGRPEGDANRGGWERYLSRFLGRLAVPLGDVGERVVASVAYDPEGVTVVLSAP